MRAESIRIHRLLNRYIVRTSDSMEVGYIVKKAAHCPIPYLLSIKAQVDAEMNVDSEIYCSNGRTYIQLFKIEVITDAANEKTSRV